MSRACLALLLILWACLSAGCSDKSTEPENPPPSTEMKHLWSKRFGDGDGQGAQAAAVDALRNVIIAGSFAGTVDFGGGVLTSAGYSDIFVAKFGSDGSHIWSKRFGDANPQEIHAVAVDASGNVIITGSFYGTVDLGAGVLTSAGDEDIFVAKFGPEGGCIWSKRFGDRNTQHARCVAADVSGNVIVSGEFYGSVDFGGGALTSAGNADIFVAKFGPDGSHAWSNRFGDGEYQLAGAVAADASGSVILTGVFHGTVDFGGGALTSAGYSDIFVAKFGSSGSHLWSKRFGDGDYQGALALAVDGSENVVVTGYFEGTVDFGSGTPMSAGGSDIFVVKFGPEGAWLWSKRFGDESYFQTGESVAVDASGNVIVTGYFASAVDFGGGVLTSAGNNDIFVAEFGVEGAHLWSDRFGDEDFQEACAAAVDASGSVIITGWFASAVDFGGGALTSAGKGDVFLAKFGR